MFAKIIKRLFHFLLVLALAAGLALLLSKVVTARYAQPRIYEMESIPNQRVAIVFGAGLRRDGSPTPILRDRVEAAAQLYFNGKVEKLLMSGDNRFLDYNEPGAMHQYALDLGVPDEDIVLDFAGRRTYDTCYRAREIFRVQEAIVVTQSFHLPRALYICNRLGVSAYGYSADRPQYRLRSKAIWNLREVPATLVAFWEVNFSRPLPVLGNPEPIF